MNASLGYAPGAGYSTTRFVRPPTVTFGELVEFFLALLEFHAGCLLKVFSSSHPENDPYLRPWKVAKDAVWLALLAATYLQFYFMDVMVQIASLPRI